ncbi:WAT1-related protein At2g37450 isoform X2 [Capsella rubella]|uniref:WAT1-related protein At2g37450 isoform X2 n=1 Tax=Capsella rubella TaxID=81985 RepID=UPI000CD535CC|nr:WAT1-related protein At2g37450 isoform X2 [Capsella rubella]
MGCMKKAMPFMLMVFLQVGLAGMDILTKDVLNKGMSIYVLAVYRHGVATVAMAPFAIYFDRLEKVKFRNIRSAAKVFGTITTVGGTMMMTLVKGPALDLFWTKGPSGQNTTGTDIHSSIKGAILVTIGCFSYACFMILQAITLKTYPAELSLATLICLMGTIEGAVVALVIEKGNPTAWAIGWDNKLLTVTYSGIMCSALGYYIGGMVMKTRGPVFVTAFKPLCMIVVAIMSSIIFSEQMYLGRALGAAVICAGLYLVIWGKAKDYKHLSTPQIDDELTKANTINSGNKKDSISLEVITINKQEDLEVITINKQEEQRRTVVETV